MASYLSRTGKRCEGYSSATFRYRTSRSRLAFARVATAEELGAEYFVQATEYI
jgi:hypothetical protein